MAAMLISTIYKLDWIKVVKKNQLCLKRDICGLDSVQYNLLIQLYARPLVKDRRPINAIRKQY